MTLAKSPQVIPVGPAQPSTPKMLADARSDADASFSAVPLGTVFDPCPKKPFWVRLALLPADAPACKDRFEATSTDGRYRKTKTVASDYIVNEESVDLEFSDAFIDKNYDIRCLPAEGEPYFIVRNVPYSELAHSPPDELPEAVAIDVIQPTREQVAVYDGPPQPPERSGGMVV